MSNVFVRVSRHHTEAVTSLQWHVDDSLDVVLQLFSGWTGLNRVAAEL